MWFGLTGALESLDYIARDFYDASTSNNEANQQSLLEKARTEVKSLTDKKEIKR